MNSLIDVCQQGIEAKTEMKELDLFASSFNDNITQFTLLRMNTSAASRLGNTFTLFFHIECFA